MKCERILRNRERFEKDMQDAWDELDERNGRMTAAEKRAERETRANEIDQTNKDRENQRAIDLENAIGKNAVEMEKARSKNEMDEDAMDEARKDREAIREAVDAYENLIKNNVVDIGTILVYQCQCTAFRQGDGKIKRKGQERSENG